MKALKWILILLLVAAGIAIALTPRWRAPIGRLLGLGEKAAAEGVYYTCPMHPAIRLPQMGDCPICGMSLVMKEAGEIEETGSISLTPRQVQLAGVRTEKIRRRSLVSQIDTVGRIDYDERRLAGVSAWIDGRVDDLFVNYTGATIDKDHRLVEIFSPQLITAQRGYLEAVRGYEQIKNSHIKESVDNAKRLMDSAYQQLLWYGLRDHQIAQLRKSWEIKPKMTILAPIGGTVIEKKIVRGEYVKTGQVLFKIADLRRVWMYADIYESDIPALMQEREGDYYLCPMDEEVRGKKGDKCPKCGMELLRRSPGVHLDITTRAYPGETFKGEVEFIDPFVNPKTRTLRVRCTINNVDLRLRPDMYVRARMETSEGSLLSVPEEAVIFSGQRRIVILDEGKGLFKPMLVKLGRMWLWEKGNVPTETTALPFHRGMRRYHEVLAGLQAGDVAVTSGNFLINSEAQLQGALDRMIESKEKEEKRDAFPRAMAGAVEVYLRIQAALAKDSFEHVGHMARELVGQVRAAQAKATEDAQAKSVEPIAEMAAKLEAKRAPKEIRDAFLALTEALLPFWVEHGGKTDLKDVHLAYCPMIKRRWIQKGKEIRNPYAVHMPTCGRIVTLTSADLLPPSDRSMRLFLETYLKIHDALAKEVAARLGDLPAELARQAEKTEFVAAARKIAKARDLKESRAAFMELSEALVPYWKKSGARLGLGARLAWCDMVKRHWIQKGKEIRNPYVMPGSNKLMPGCGNLVDE